MITCQQCGKEINMARFVPPADGDPYTAIEHYQQPTGKLTEYFFHTACFLEVAGEEYGPRAKKPTTEED